MRRFRSPCRTADRPARPDRRPSRLPAGPEALVVAALLVFVSPPGGSRAQERAATDTAAADTVQEETPGGPAAGGIDPAGGGIGGPAELAPRLERILADPVFTRAHVGLTVQVAETGEVLFDRAGEKRFTAASTVKLVTAAAALRRLGPEHRWTTTLAAAAPAREGVLDGDLWVVGSGDPSVTEDRLRSWAALVREAGIRRITGDVVGDDRAFEPPLWGRGWMWDDLHLGWSAGVSGLQLEPPSVRAALHPGAGPGDPATVRVRRATEHLPVRFEVRTGAPGSDVRLRLEPRRPGGPSYVRGWIPADVDSVPLDLAPSHPTLLFLERFGEALDDVGVDVDGELRRARPHEAPPWEAAAAGTPAAGPATGPARSETGAVRPDARVGRLEAGAVATGTRPVGPTWSRTLRSDSLGALLPDLLRPSDNRMAETLLRTLGREEGRAGSAGEGLDVVGAVLADWGVAPGSVAMADGSGLSRYDQLTPAALVRVLRAVWRQPWYPLFRGALPAPRERGTLKGRFLGIPAEESVRAKTGSLASVRGLAGYVEDGDGETLVFALLVNGYDVPGDTAAGLRDLLVEQLTLYHRPVAPGWPRHRRPDRRGPP